MATFASLPLDVLVVILSHSHDLDSLLSSRASCRAFFNAFNNSPTSLTKSIVTRHIDAAVLPEATLVAQATQVRLSRPPSSKLPKTFVSRLLSGRNNKALLNHRWTLSDGIAVIKLHSIITRFAKQFACFYLGWLEANSGISQVDPSDGELARIIRALYRFEIFCILFPPPVLPPQEKLLPIFREPQVTFLLSFSPWENEQLACVQEGLWRLVAPAFNDVVLHDISWGEFETEYAHEPSNLDTEYILSRGLRGIHDIACADTYARRYELIAAGAEIPTYTTLFLCRALSEYNNVVWDRERSAIESGEEAPTPGARPFYKDPDNGPERVWDLSHPIGRAMAGEERYRSMRDCGCVFWDAERLGQAGLWDPETWFEFETEDAIAVLAPSLEEQKLSWDIRTELSANGFSGYWDGKLMPDVSG